MFRILRVSILFVSEAATSMGSVIYLTYIHICSMCIMYIYKYIYIIYVCLHITFCRNVHPYTTETQILRTSRKAQEFTEVWFEESAWSIPLLAGLVNLGVFDTLFLRGTEIFF